MFKTVLLKFNNDYTLYNICSAWFLDIRMYQLVSSPITGVVITVISHPDNNHYVVCPLGY